MSLRIGCDVDGTLADMSTALRRLADPLYAGGGAARRTRRDLTAAIAGCEDFWYSLAEIEPGAVAGLAAAAQRHRWEVIFLTQRGPSAGDTPQRQTQRWLAAHGYEWPSVYVVTGSRGRIADALALDAVIDDTPSNCLDVGTDSKATPILLWRGARDAAPAAADRLGIQTVFSMADAVTRLEAREPRRRPRLAERIRAAVGVF
jgi:hypothetical protein